MWTRGRSMNGTIDYYTHLSVGGGWRGRPVHFRNEQPVNEEGYFPGLMTKEAVRYIEQATLISHSFCIIRCCCPISRCRCPRNGLRLTRACRACDEHQS